MSEWYYSPVLARRYSETHEKSMQRPPHWVRCEYVHRVEGEVLRCTKGEGHENGHDRDHDDGLKKPELVSP